MSGQGGGGCPRCGLEEPWDERSPPIPTWEDIERYTNQRIKEDKDAVLRGAKLAEAEQKILADKNSNSVRNRFIKEAK